ncbi:unnamed protein product [marine sediment metagenome]|uniref:Uncharacterized protein n=1 Tax=marine sediment metagenome TaxID=412755 RepID=X1DEV3_9ZZZZ
MLIYGKQSYSAEVYLHPETATINWRDDFPRCEVASVPGKHEELSWKDESVAQLAKILLRDRCYDSISQIEDDKRDDYKLICGPNGVDQVWYLEKYSDVADAGVDPIFHYLEYGWREGRDPRPDFSTSAYLTANEDVARAGCNPLVHYIRLGRPERYPSACPVPQIERGGGLWSAVKIALKALHHRAPGRR